MTSECIFCPSIGGDPITPSICPDGQRCGGSSHDECSGGYECDETSTSNNSGTTDSWPTGVPLPDDPNKIPQKCDIQQANNGVTNSDDFVPLTEEQIQKETTDAWRVEMSVLPLKPVIIQAKL